jgi:hypothetical protein
MYRLINRIVVHVSLILPSFRCNISMLTALATIHMWCRSTKCLYRYVSKSSPSDQHMNSLGLLSSTPHVLGTKQCIAVAINKHSSSHTIVCEPLFCHSQRRRWCWTTCQGLGLGLQFCRENEKVNFGSLRTCLTSLPRTSIYFEVKNHHVDVHIIGAIVGSQMASVLLALPWLSRPCHSTEFDAAKLGRPDTQPRPYCKDSPD